MLDPPFPIHPILASESFPDLFKVRQPPERLFVQGKAASLGLLEKLPHRGLAIVGSRECQNRSRHLVHSVLQRLAGFDLVILSGLARGIDSEAHLGSLEAGIPTIAVLGCGLDRSYPPENHSLRTRILESGGLVVSEFDPDAAPIAGHFIQRNRLIAGWAAATWVVEAGFQSGAINTASWAKKHERPCFVTPCFPGDPALAGNQRLFESEKLDEGIVRPLWNEKSLGEIWLELESFFAAKTKKRPTQAVRPPESKNPEFERISRKLCQETFRHSVERGGISLAELQSWSDSQGIEAEQFFPALRAALERKRLILRQGVLTTSTKEFDSPCLY